MSKESEKLPKYKVLNSEDDFCIEKLKEKINKTRERQEKLIEAREAKKKKS